jgi:acyl carrier protein phosphodiesterase
MNHLAHIFLSGNSDYVKIGNFIGDYIKGKKYKKYAPEIQNGIIMHRNIDNFTDNNETPKKIKPLFAGYYGKYAGIITDVFYDHFLAVNWDNFSDVPLENFVNRFYTILEENKQVLPRKVQNFLPRMIENDRIYSYKYFQGLEKALSVMSKHTSLPDYTSKAMNILSDNYSLINRNFLEFFPKIINFITEHYSVDIQKKAI